MIFSHGFWVPLAAVPGLCQAITWTNTDSLFTRPFRTNFIEILIKIWTFSFEKVNLKILSAAWWPFLFLPWYVKMIPVRIQILVFNSLWPDDAILHWRSWSTLVQVRLVAWLHRAMSWTNVVLPTVRSRGIHSFQDNTNFNHVQYWRYNHNHNPNNMEVVFEIYTLEITATFPRGQWVKKIISSPSWWKVG